MKKVLALLSAFALAPLGAWAQTALDPDPIALACAYNIVAPSPIAGNFYFVQCDANGKLITSSTGGGSPGGANTNVQFNDSGAFGGQADFNYTKASGLVRASSIAIGGASIGTKALAVTGTSAFGGVVVLGVDASGSNATATSNVIRAPLSTGTATNPDYVIQTGVKTTTGSAQATATTAVTFSGETQDAVFTPGTNRFLIVNRQSGGGNYFAVDNQAGNVLVTSVAMWGWSSSSTNAFGGTDTTFSRVSAGLMQIGTTAANALGSINLANLTASGKIMIGSASSLALNTGEVGMATIAASGSAPGPSGGKFEMICGTNSGSIKLIMYGGTSTTPITIVDNVGAGATGC